MKRSMMQIYVKNSAEAVAVYRKAFDAKLGYHVKNDDGSFYHSELDVYGQILSVAESMDGSGGTTGSIMQFCLHFAKGEETALLKAYDALKEGAEILHPMAACEFAEAMSDLIDRFGVRWCLFLEG